MIHMDLMSYYDLMFAFVQFHKYSWTEVENMVPWERDVIVMKLKNHLEEEKLKQQQNGS